MRSLVKRVCLAVFNLITIKYVVLIRANFFAKTETQDRKTVADIDLISRCVFRVEYFIKF